MIIQNWQTFRLTFSNGLPDDASGVPGWPVADMRAGGFDGGVVMTTASPPWVLTCNALAADAAPGVDEFDWYVSQPGGLGGPLAIARHDISGTTQNSGSIELTLSAWAAAEYPEPFNISTIPVLWAGIDAYVRRRSDGAIQRLDIQALLLSRFGDLTDVG